MELPYYRDKIYRGISIQPDLQYIVNPGTTPQEDNALGLSALGFRYQFLSTLLPINTVTGPSGAAFSRSAGRLMMVPRMMRSVGSDASITLPAAAARCIPSVASFRARLRRAWKALSGFSSAYRPLW